MRVHETIDLRPIFERAIRFSEGADEGEESEEEESEESEEEESEEEESEQEDPEKSAENVDGLKSALKKERAARKKAEKDARTLAKFKAEAEGKDTSEAEKASKRAEKAEGTSVKLAEKLRNQAVDIAITKAAQDLKFKDTDDALAQIRRDEDWVEQDEDDPSEIEVDSDEVVAAVKALAKKKPYLIQAEGETDPSGSKFGGKKNNSEAMSDEKLREKYSALRQ